METLSLRLFLRIAELGGVSRAARDLSMSPASASARLAKLEEVVGFRLFTRTTRAVSLTTDGAEFLPYAKQALDTLATGLDVVTGKEAWVQGLLRMTVPGSFGRMHIVPYLAEFQGRYPDVVLDLRLSDEVLNLVEGAYDLVVRNAPLDDSSLIARKLAPDARILVAAPSYLARCPEPMTPKDILQHRCVVLRNSRRVKFQDGQVIAMPASSVVNDGEAMRLLIENGLGLGVSSRWSAAESLKRGTLIEILSAFPLLTESAIWALYPSKRLVPPRVRAMIDFLLEKFWPDPPWG
ncbi:MAG: LysR family transcriptional regulator [Myxococcota bacterium]